MAKNKQTSKNAQPETPSTDSSETTPKPQPPTKEERRALFEAYDAAAAELDTAQKALEKAKDAASARIEEIHKRCGNGPFNRNGKKMKIWKYTTKSETEGVPDKVTFHFRVEKDEDVIEV